MTNKREIKIDSPVSFLTGIGPKKTKALEKLDVFSLEDLFFLKPRRYEDRKIITHFCDLNGAIEGNICAIADVLDVVFARGRTEAVISDNTAEIKAIWFTEKIGAFLDKGMRIALYGPVIYFNKKPQLSHPKFEIMRGQRSPELIGSIVPIYPGTADLTQKNITGIIDSVINYYADDILKEFLPKKIIEHYGMMSFRDAIIEIHKPLNHLSFIRARNRLSFDELFLLQIGILMRRNLHAKTKSRAFSILPGKYFYNFINSLNFKITNAQERAIKEIFDDIKKDLPMNRLLQGDVGSGKTLVAVAAILATVDSSAQAAFMAPTEILAQQHYLKLKKNLEPMGLKIGILTGSLKSQEKKEILDSVQNGTIKILVGTHAIFKEKVNFKNLGMVIVDEQHRFGVLQRNALISKGNSPHVLAMTATPIPRTLVLSVYGDLEVSVLDELPKGRQKIKTIALKPIEFHLLIKIIRDCVKSGQQAYWVCPLIEEGEKRLSAVTSTFEYLSRLMPDIKIAMLHGQFQADEKFDIMQNFASGKIDLLVSTIVIEVGVDVPNASLMIIQDAGQFGLAQLHQLRGRVGRGTAKSLCVLLEGNNTTEDGQERIKSMIKTSDGFELAELDLAQRGPGEICGIRQHGITDFRIAELVRDQKILNLAKKEALALINEDPDLNSEPLLRNELMRRLGDTLEIAVTA